MPNRRNLSCSCFVQDIRYFGTLYVLVSSECDILLHKDTSFSYDKTDFSPRQILTSHHCVSSSSRISNTFIPPFATWSHRMYSTW